MKLKIISHSLALVMGIIVNWLATSHFSAERAVAHTFSSQSDSKNVSTANESPRQKAKKLLITAVGPSLTEILAIREPVAQLDALTLWAQALALDGETGCNELKNIQNKVLRQAAEASFYCALAQIDAEVAFRLATENSLRSDNFAWGGLYECLTARKPQIAVSALRNMPPGAIRTKLTNTVAGTWAERSVTEALSWASTLGPVEKSAALATIFAAGSMADPTSAAAAAQTLTPGKSRTNAMVTVGGALAMEDPDHAMSWAASLLNGSDRDAAISGILMRLSNEDPQAAAKWLDKVPAGKIRRELTQQIAGQLALNDSRKAIEWLRERDELGSPSSAAPVLWVMGEENPQQAITEFSSILASPELADHVSHLAESLIQCSCGASAMESALAVHDPAARKVIVAKVAEQWALVDPEGAWREAQSRPELLNAMIPSLATAAPSLVAEQLQMMPHVDLGNLVPSFASALSEVDPGAAAKLLADYPAGDSMWQESADQVSAAWADLDPSVAAKSSLELTGNLAETVRSHAVEKWLGEDATGACGWIQQLPMGAVRDDAIKVLVGYTAADNPQAGMAWLTLVSDPAARESLLEQLKCASANVK